MDKRLEERYIVIKIKHLDAGQREGLYFIMADLDIPSVDSVVIEEDWPEYKPTVDLLMKRVNNEQ